jgi:uncharacterized protein
VQTGGAAMPLRVVPPPKKRRRRAVPGLDASSGELLGPQSDVPPGGLGTDRSRPEADVSELSWIRFDGLVQTLARRIRRTFAPEAVVGVAHGGVFVGGALASALGVDFFPVRISRRSRASATVRQTPRLSGSMPRELKGRRVLLVDDVSASGATLELARKLAIRAGARAVRTATLVSREGGFAPDWSALPSDALFVFPWDYAAVTEDERFDAVPRSVGRPRERR